VKNARRKDAGKKKNHVSLKKSPARTSTGKRTLFISGCRGGSQERGKELGDRPKGLGKRTQEPGKRKKNGWEKRRMRLAGLVSALSFGRVTVTNIPAEGGKCSWKPLEGKKEKLL